VARELLGALAHVHGAGLLHRDIKPGNILLDAEARTHLTDFGIARASDATSITQTGVVLGTMRYLAPEVAHGDPASEASDLYSAGVVLREVGTDDAAPELQALVKGLTAEDPALRPSSAREALQELDPEPTAPTRVFAEASTATTHLLRSSPPALPPWHELRRHAWFAPAVALAAVAVLAGIVVALAGGGGSSPSASAPRASDSLQQQLRGIDRAIDAARK
jgi:serine/threonine-protein kinase